MIRAEHFTDRPAQPRDMNLPMIEVTRVAAPARHGEIIREAERQVAAADRWRLIFELGFYLTAVLLTVAWVLLLAAIAVRLTA